MSTEAPSAIQPGDVVAATVKAKSAERFELDTAAGPAHLPLPEVGSELPEVGASIEVFVDKLGEDGEPLVVSKEKADLLRLWDGLVAASKDGRVLEGDVLAEVKGGLSVDVGIKAFLPASQLDLRPVHELRPWVGKRLAVKVIELNAKRGNLVVSHRAVLEAEREVKKHELVKSLHEGDVVSGTVVRFVDYGAFVDLGGADGLVHASDLSWGRGARVDQVLKLGQELEFKVLKIDREKERISLGRKQLSEDPWLTAKERYPQGARVRGQVVGIVDYGCFVEIEPGVEGLVHVSELSWARRVSPADVVQPGVPLEAVVLGVDVKDRKISLSKKRLEESPFVSFQKAHPAGSRLKAVVRRHAEFGLFVGLPFELEGLVHVSDLSWNERGKEVLHRHKKGEELELVVLEVDTHQERIGLGLKQLTADPWAEAKQRLKPGAKITGTVTKVVDFGAFVEVMPGVEGLCHITELADERIEDIHAHVKQGQSLELVVLDLDLRERRLSLSVRAVGEAGGGYRQVMAEMQKTKLGTLGDKLSKSLKGR